MQRAKVFSHSLRVLVCQDLAELGIDIELFAMNKLDKVFNVDLFYKNLLSFSVDEETGAIHFDASAKFEELQLHVRRKEFKKRTLGKLSMSIGENFGFKMLLSCLTLQKSGSSYTHYATKQKKENILFWIVKQISLLKQ